MVCGSTRPTRSSTRAPHRSSPSSTASVHAAVDRPDAGVRRGPSQPRRHGASGGARAAGTWTACGPTTSTTSSGARSRATSTGTIADFAGTADELADDALAGLAVRRSAHRAHAGRARGTDPADVPMHRRVVCVQNHDQIGNRALGERLNHEIDPAAWRAAVALLLTAPMTPLLFMGQEWAASTPFLFFTDFEPELGARVAEGRRREFADFPAFATPEAARRDSRSSGGRHLRGQPSPAGTSSAAGPRGEPCAPSRVAEAARALGAHCAGPTDVRGDACALDRRYRAVHAER